jgi:hypothetical protein
MARERYNYFIKNPSITIQLERLQPSFSGIDQLARAICRQLAQWDDVWGQCQVRISDARCDYDWSQKEK